MKGHNIARATKALPIMATPVIRINNLNIIISKYITPSMV